MKASIILGLLCKCDGLVLSKCANDAFKEVICISLKTGFIPCLDLCLLENNTIP